MNREDVGRCNTEKENRGRQGSSFLSNCTSGGCGAKIGPGELSELLAALEVKNDPALLVGFGGRDDAAVYRIDAERALVSTVDFFSPMVEDPCLFGKIAAANALSDIYAMGGRPVFALNLVCFPEKLDRGILRDILAGGAAKLLEADTRLAGGHSIFDHEPKYGLAVTGFINPQRILRNDACKAGDALILTKALGVGLVMAALRGGEASPAIVKAAADSMERLNRYAAEKFSNGSPLASSVHACTDVTGFGLAVHASEMAGTDHSLVIDGASLPLLEGALDFAENFYATAAGQRNRNYMEGTPDPARAGKRIGFDGVSTAMQEIVFDPQTSGGLLISVAAEAAQELCAAIRRDDPAAAVIGEVTPRDEAAVLVI
ncbi:MAG: selenide, water dikinase SelD [Treponema sp.]|jgi:selenide,water dikinase|nr:selenide, water dikinase SelD [Treponema sp.]